MAFYIRVGIVLALAAILYGGVCPALVSAPDSIMVIAGITTAVLYPFLAGYYLVKHYRKTFNA